ncbi:recombinase family protein [Tundrisphaera sp. TA3]|uniref:recombinase family protein n=1 Tax=Tundrisphaera sp. TA3 TaxID=3435775 RepID=UPI003EBC4661
MPRIYSYARFSSERQSLGDSTRRQLDASRAWCERNNFVLDESLRITDSGVSAYRGKNVKEGALAGFLKLVEDGKIPTGSILILESLDRLTREEIPEALTLFMKILSAGVTIQTLTPERTHTRSSIGDIAGIIEPIIIFSRANEESAMKSSRSKANWTQKRKLAREGKQVTTHCPWWLEMGHKGFQEIPDRADVVRKMYEMRSSGLTIPAIQKWLNESGVKPRFAKAWNASMISHILKTRTVLGEYQPTRTIDGKKVDEGEPIAGFYPAVVPLDVYHRAQKIKVKKGRTGDKFCNIFRGVLVSSLTHSPFIVHGQVETYADGTQVTTRRLITSGFISQVPGADPARVPYFPFEKGFLQGLQELDPADFAPKDETDISRQLASLSGEIAEVDAKLATIQARIKTAKAIEPLLDLVETLTEDRQSLQGQLEVLQDQVSNHRMEVVGEIQSLSRMIANANEEDARILRMQIRGRMGTLINKVFLTVEELDGKVGKRKKWEARCLVFFAGGGIRFFAVNHDGEVSSGNWRWDDLPETAEALIEGPVYFRVDRDLDS